jgi:hypothetical protein
MVYLTRETRQGLMKGSEGKYSHFPIHGNRRNTLYSILQCERF